MTIVQTGDKLSLETKLITEQGEQVVPDSYMLDGKEVEFTPRTPADQAARASGPLNGAPTATAIEVNEKSTFDGPKAPSMSRRHASGSLSADGKTLKIEMTVDGPNGKQQLKRTFIKK